MFLRGVIATIEQAAEDSLISSLILRFWLREAQGSEHAIQDAFDDTKFPV